MGKSIEDIIEKILNKKEQEQWKIQKREQDKKKTLQLEQEAKERKIAQEKYEQECTKNIKTFIKGSVVFLIIATFKSVLNGFIPWRDNIIIN